MHNWAIGILLLTLTGCTTTKYVEPPKLSYPMPEAIQPSGVKWKVITKETIKKEKDDIVLIGMSYDDSISHRQWLEKVAVYIEKQKSIICKYQECK